MSLTRDVLLLICDKMEDSRGLFLACKYLCDNCSDRAYWQASGNNRLTSWLPKIKTDHSLNDFIKANNLTMVKYLITSDMSVIAAATDACAQTENMKIRRWLWYSIPPTSLYRKNVVELASEYGRLEILKYLVYIGVDVLSSENFIAQLASSNGHLEVVKYLVSIGVDITAYDDAALRYASYYGHLETVKYLVSVGANVSALGNNPVQLASENGHLETVKYLVSVGADVTANHNEAICMAYENSHVETVKYLVSIGANMPD